MMLRVAPISLRGILEDIQFDKVVAKYSFDVLFFVRRTPLKVVNSFHGSMKVANFVVKMLKPDVLRRYHFELVSGARVS